MCLFSFFSGTRLYAETDHQLWLAYLNQGRITDKAGYWVDVNFRTHNQFANNFSTVLFRIGGSYFIKDNLRFSAGYVYAMGFPSLSNQSFFKQEHRPWQHIQYGYVISPKVRLNTGFRAEERFIQKSKGEKIVPGYEFRNRLRLSAGLSVQINRQKLAIGNIFLLISNEVMVNAYSTDKAKLLDQNRAFIGLGFQVAEPFQIQMGYMHWYLATTKGYDHIHTLRLNLVHTPDFRKKK